MTKCIIYYDAGVRKVAELEVKGHRTKAEVVVKSEPYAEIARIIREYDYAGSYFKNN